jgi:hypothetical protein
MPNELTHKGESLAEKWTNIITELNKGLSVIDSTYTWNKRKESYKALAHELLLSENNICLKEPCHECRGEENLICAICNGLGFKYIPLVKENK